MKTKQVGSSYSTATIFSFATMSFVASPYVEITDAVKKIDTVTRKIILMSTEGYGKLNKTIDFDKIISITGDLVDYMDDAMD